MKAHFGMMVLGRQRLQFRLPAVQRVDRFPLLRGAVLRPRKVMAVTASHMPVLLTEVLAALAPAQGGRYIDGTFGAGGYSAAILASAHCSVLGIDQDPTAITAAAGMQARFGDRLHLIEGRFGALDQHAALLGWPAVDGVVLDIGVSSMQIDQAKRGFSFRQDGPLDMRMSMTGQSAADLVNTASEEELADIFFHYGEERLARSVARAIVHDRKTAPFLTTRSLADLLGRIIHSKPGQIHPATRVFQALRIAVNSELQQLVDALHAAESMLKPGGILAVVTFHSLEDRIVKQFLAARSGRGGSSRFQPLPAAGEATFRIEGKWPQTASDAEAEANPRARSAKLRVAIRNEAPARPDREREIEALAVLPDTKTRRRKS
jgi:16S rRNA (cytosine1402-N4)-methyltransferase